MIRNVDGHDPEEIKIAIETARKSDQPTLICCKTTIGFGSPNKQGKEDCHGAPLGDAEIALTRAALNGTTVRSKSRPTSMPSGTPRKPVARPKPNGISVSLPTLLPSLNWPTS